MCLPVAFQVLGQTIDSFSVQELWVGLHFVRFHVVQIDLYQVGFLVASTQRDLVNTLVWYPPLDAD